MNSETGVQEPQAGAAAAASLGAPPARDSAKPFQQALPSTVPPPGQEANADPNAAAFSAQQQLVTPIAPLNPLSPGQLAAFGVVDFSKEDGGSGQFILGADAASMEQYLADTAAFERQTVRWVHVSWARAVAQRAIAGSPNYPPKSVTDAKGTTATSFYQGPANPAGLDQGIAEADRMIQLARSLATYKATRIKPTRTYQKQTLSIDEYGVSLSIPVYAEDRIKTALAEMPMGRRRGGAKGQVMPRPLHPVPTAIQYADRTGTPFRVGTGSEAVLGTADVETSNVKESVLEAMARIEGRLLKRGRLELRLEFVRGWRVDDIRMLLITSLSLLDDELDSDLFADLQGSILSTVNLYTDAPSLIGAILRAMLEVSAEVVTFLEESFSDAESLVFAKPSTIYQQGMFLQIS